MSDAHISFPGDACLSVAFDRVIDPAVNERCVALAGALERTRRTGIRDIVSGFHTVVVYFDPLTISREALAADVERAMADRVPPSAEDDPPVEIPVRYGGDGGPDLGAVAAFGGCSEDDVIRMHTGAIYRVYMLGFLPGFAYLGSVDPRIAMPRLASPRVAVSAGSVGIAGGQTGIYPCETPGGWRIIGRTDVRMFDPALANPSLLRPGQRVEFVAA
jgi:KipI family sensor histidine kinase inhibitor